MSHRRSHRTLTVLIGVALATAAALGSPPAWAAPAVYGQVHHFESRNLKSGCTPSGQSGGPVDQATVLARAQVWVDQNIDYTQTCGHNPGGYYREDCSGFVSMAWELNTSLSSWDFNPAYNGGDARFQQIPQSDLVPGDAVVADNSTSDHIALFTGWGSNDHGMHRYANLSEESDFGVGTIAVTNQDLDGSYWGTFTPIHYTKMASTQPALSSGSSVYVPTDSSYHVFWTGPTGHAMQTYFVSGAWHTQDLGGVIVGAPAVTYANGRFDLFAVSPGGHLFQRTHSGTWGSWQNLDGSWTPGVTAVFEPVSRTYDVFGHDPSGHLQQYYWSDYWSGSWQRADLGGVTAGTPGVSYQDGRFDLFAVSPAGRLFKLSYSGAWGGWHRIGTAGYAPGAAAIPTPTGFRVFLRATNGHMMQLYHDAVSWHGPIDLGGTFDRAPGVTFHGGRYDLFGLNSDGLYQSIDTNTWSTWHHVPA